jgi:CheY-like chemotaxis protein
MASQLATKLFQSIGITTDELAKIFQPFFTTKETGLSTGLGLSVSHGILSQQNGNIWAESTPEAGTTFHIELPVTKIESSTPVTVDSDRPAISSPDRSTTHVLVVDDEPDLRLVLSRQLEIRRYNVDQAGDGEEAWRKLQNFDYNCILLDLRMPGMGGQALYERVKAISPKLLNRIVFITGDTVNQATTSFLSSVPNLVLSKPFDFRELEQLVVSVIGQEPMMSDNETAVI